MKRFIAIILLLFLVSGDAFAYAIKLYNKKGNMIGTARKIGEDYEIYDLDDHLVKDFDAFYASEGDPERRTLKETSIFQYIPGLEWAGPNNWDRTKRIKNEKGEYVTVLRYNPFLVRHLKVKIYDKTGKFIGYAITDGTTDFKLYDKNEKPMEYEGQVYVQPTGPLRSYWDIFKVHPYNNN